MPEGGPLRREAVFPDQWEDFGGGCGDVGAGAVDGANPGFFQEIVVFGGDDAATDDEDVGRALLPQSLDQGRDEGLVAGGMRRYADDVGVVFDRLTGDFFGR